MNAGGSASAFRIIKNVGCRMRGAILVHYEEYDSAMADVDQADKLMPDDSFTLQYPSDSVNHFQEYRSSSQLASGTEPRTTCTMHAEYEAT